MAFFIWRKGVEIKKTLALFFTFLLCLAGQANAEIINGGFEKNDFTGWETFGDLSIQTAAFGTTPSEGVYQALLTTSLGAEPSEDIWEFSEILPRTSQTPAHFSEGSSMKQHFYLSAPGHLSLDYNFLVNCYEGSTTENTGRFRIGVVSYDIEGNIIGSEILHSGGGIFLCPGGTVPSSTVFDRESGYITWGVNLDRGQHTIEFVILDMKARPENEYGLLIDNIVFTSDIDAILDFFDESVADGTLEGYGSGNSANGRLTALRNMLEMAGDLINIGDIDGACGQLEAASMKCDGEPLPPDFVTGEAIFELHDMITELMAELGCE